MRFPGTTLYPEEALIRKLELLPGDKRQTGVKLALKMALRQSLDIADSPLQMVLDLLFGYVLIFLQGYAEPEPLLFAPPFPTLDVQDALEEGSFVFPSIIVSQFEVPEPALGLQCGQHPGHMVSDLP